MIAVTDVQLRLLPHTLSITTTINVCDWPTASKIYSFFALDHHHALLDVVLSLLDIHAPCLLDDRRTDIPQNHLTDAEIGYLGATLVELNDGFSGLSVSRRL